jgi:hypothetical protein
MADRHPFAEHRQHHVEKERVSHIAHGHKHRASGGRVHKDEAQDRKLFGKMIAEHDREAEGKKSKHRRDRVARAKGGKVKGKGATHVNVIVGGQHANPPTPAMMPPGPPMPPPGAGGAPPPLAPPGGPVAGLGGPPGMGPMRARGGPVESPKNMKPRAKGGGVKSGPAWTESMKTKTPVQHSAAKEVDIKNMNRPKPATYAKGGRVEAPMGVESASKLPGGGAGGAGRRAKIGKYAFGKPMKEVNGAR